MRSLHKKLEALEAALGSPSDTAAGLARRLMKESPAPSLLFQTPRLSTPAGASGTHEIDLNTSADLFATPKPPPPSGNPPPRKRPREEDRKRTAAGIFHVSTAAGKPLGNSAAGNKVWNRAVPLGGNPTAGKPGAGVSAPVRNVGSVLAKSIPFGVPVNFSRSTSSSVFREGYNGLGGHEKVVVLPARHKHSAVLKRPVVGGQMKRVFGPSKTAKTPPPLPSLGEAEDY